MKSLWGTGSFQHVPPQSSRTVIICRVGMELLHVPIGRKVTDQLGSEVDGPRAYPGWHTT